MARTCENRKRDLMRAVDKLEDRLVAMSDFIFNNPEVGYQEVKAATLLTDFLRENGFSVELGYGGLDTAFRAIYRQGNGGPCIGLLCEYDAIVNVGHACAHHLQGPCIAGAALAVKELAGDLPYTLEVIGTPAEETAEGGKNIMLENGAFKHLDVALMMHGSDSTTTDIKSMACTQFQLTYKGISAHAAIAPEKGRSALEALMLVFNGLAYLRGHIRDDARIHGIIENGGQAVNAIPEKAMGRVEVRAYDRPYLDEMIERVQRIFEGAALMTDTSYEVKRIGNFHNKIPVLALNHLLMQNAELAEAKAIAPPREKTGSTDFASVMYFVPGSCIRVAFMDKGVTAHSQAWLEKGLSADAHAAMLMGAKILAMTVSDLIADRQVLDEIHAEFQREKAKLSGK